jgi:hypothetical protein
MVSRQFNGNQSMSANNPIAVDHFIGFGHRAIPTRELRELQMMHQPNLHAGTKEEEDEYLDFDPTDPDVQEITDEEFFDRYFEG